MKSSLGFVQRDSGDWRIFCYLFKNVLITFVMKLFDYKVKSLQILIHAITIYKLYKFNREEIEPKA